MFLRFFITCSVISICVKAHPSRLKILPGLAFYRTDDGHDDSDNSLMDKDKDLLKSMWNIVDKMDSKVYQSGSSSNTYDTPGAGGGHEEPAPTRSPPSPPQSFHNKPSMPSHPGPPGPHGPHGARPTPLGTPITTINVYSTYPATAAVKGEPPYTATTTYHHAPPYHGGGFGSNPFNAADRNRDPRYNQNNLNSPPNFEGPKSQRPFDSFMPPPNNPAPFEPPSVPPQDSMISQSQYESLMNPNGGLGQPFDAQLDNSENLSRSMFDINSSQGDDMGQGYGGGMGMENSAGSAPLQFLMPHMDPNSQMRPMDDMMPDNYQSMNLDPIRSHMNY